MTRTLRHVLLLFFVGLAMSVSAKKRVIDMSLYGLRPNTAENLSTKLRSALNALKQEAQKSGDHLTLRFTPGTYHFHAEGMGEHTFYASNHDQPNPKRVAFWLDGWNGLTIDGGGADFIFHGRLTPFVLQNAKHCTLKNFSVDFSQPQIGQIEITENRGEGGICFRPAPWMSWQVDANGRFIHRGEGWESGFNSAIAFENATRHIVYRTSDLSINVNNVSLLPTDTDTTLLAPRWHDARLQPGMVLALRTYSRPCPGIVLAENLDTRLSHVTVHYAEGMGLVAQRCTDIRLDHFNVCLRGNADPRYFTTQADATHFSQCRGVIVSKNGLYEGMMDDAINVHGIYLEVVERRDAHTLRCRFSHEQCYGFAWADKGDVVRFIRSASMDHLAPTCRIAHIQPVGGKLEGCKEFLIEFADTVPAEVGRSVDGKMARYGVENLTWTPEVRFAHNTVRNNRARGALFSSPRLTICENNLFDHTSGAAIVLCGDCNGWYESGAVGNLVIRRNKFVNALTNLFQFTAAVISIYPEIPHLEQQTGHFHGAGAAAGLPGATKKARGIVIEKNEFQTFDLPLLYAKSVDGLVWRDNIVVENHDYPAFHPNKKRIALERCVNVDIKE